MTEFLTTLGYLYLIGWWGLGIAGSIWMYRWVEKPLDNNWRFLLWAGWLIGPIWFIAAWIFSVAQAEIGGD